MALFDDEWLEEDDGFGFDLSPLLDLSPEARDYANRLADAMRTPLAPGDPRRHHYVPQFYLRRFADGDQIARVDLATPNEHQGANVKDVAVVKDLYTTVDAEVGETVAVERILSMLDGDAAGAIERLAYGLLFPPQRRDRISLALWMSVMHVRGPEHRRQVEAMADNMMKMQLSLIDGPEAAHAHLAGPSGEQPEPEMIEALLEVVDDLDSFEFVPHQNEMVRNMLDFGLQAAPFFLGRLWSVVKFPEDGLVLTDKPLALYQKPEHRSPWMGVGIGNADEVWVPLDRRTALILHNEELVGERVIKAPPEHSVDDFNQAIVSQAGHEVYCHPDDLWRLRRLRLPRADRPLFQVSGGDWNRGTTDGVNAPPRRRKHMRYRRDSQP